MQSHDDIHALVRDDMRAVDERISEALRSDVALINQISTYIIASGGKRLRPTLVLLSAGAYGYDGRRHVDLAAIIEFIHTATLLHDDVVDSSEMRRGQETPASFGVTKPASWLAISLFACVSADGRRWFHARLEIFANTTNVIAEGEVLQLLNINEPDTTEAQYLEVIRSKTAKLFEAAARMGPMLLGMPADAESAMAAYGAHLGTAFQLVDDMLDYSGASDEIGKNLGDDLAEGKPTLPLIHAMRHGTPGQVSAVREAIKTGGRDNIDEILAAVESTGAITYTAQAAKDEAERAAKALREVPTRTKCIGRLTKIAVQRRIEPPRAASQSTSGCSSAMALSSRQGSEVRPLTPTNLFCMGGDMGKLAPASHQYPNLTTCVQATWACSLETPPSSGFRIFDGLAGPLLGAVTIHLV